MHVGGGNAHTTVEDTASKATLTSPRFNATAAPLCVHYWYSIGTKNTGTNDDASLFDETVQSALPPFDYVAYNRCVSS